jgi:hypothetical protein
MNYLQARILGLQPPCPFILSFRFRHNFLLVVIPVLLIGKLGSGSAR